MQDRSFKRSNDMSRLNSDYGNKENGFRRKNNRNNGNVEKLIAKYNELAREALSNGDKILSENYYQYADHFLRISIEQKEKQKLKCFAFTYIKTISWHICANLETVLRETKRSNHAQKLRAFLEQLERN